MTQALFDTIVDTGGAIDRHQNDVVQAWLPVGALETIAARPEVRRIRPPDYASPQTGSVTTAGDSVLRASDARQLFSVTGEGVRVGVISDGLAGLSTSIASGNLPATTFHCRSSSLVITLRASGCLAAETLVATSGGIVATSFRSGGDVAPLGDAEGTAMLEIVHDLAPGAELWFAGASTGIEILVAWDHLSKNVDVVISDLVVASRFPDGLSLFTRTIEQLSLAAGIRARSFVQAAGNYADAHYTGTYVNSGIGDFLGNYHLFEVTSLTAGPVTPLPFNQITIPALGTRTIYLSWNDPEGASANDYDLLALDCVTGDLLDASIDIQDGNDDPSETVVIANPFLFPLDVCYAVVNAFNLAAPRTLNIFIDRASTHLYNTPSRSIVAPADTAIVISVGAVAAATPSQIELYSSLGPTLGGLSKPDLVATDKVAVSGAGGFGSPFPGTSAAAPHVAAIVALLLQADPSLTRTEITSIIKSSSSPLGDANTFGSGRIDALQALIQVLGPPPVTLTVVTNGAGTVTGPGIGCGADCTETYSAGSQVKLAPTSSAGWIFSGWSGGGCVGVSECTVTMTANTTVTATFVAETTGRGLILAAVLPSSRSTQVGTPATVFAAIINFGPGTAISCRPSPLTSIPATFTFHTTNPLTNQLTGTPNTPADIAAGSLQTYVLAFTPTAPFPPTDVQVTFDCANTAAAIVIAGLNTVLLSASATPIPDIVALAATLGGDGIVNIFGLTGTGVFAVATVNVGVAGMITANVDAGGVPLPVSLSLCQTSPATGQCLSPPASSVTTTILAGQTPTFGVFVRGVGAPVAFSPGVNRIYVRFRDDSGVTRGSTSVAVQTR
ncbi:MAG: S8 family serine peptidase [Candidatus Rokuibacteriota bacterium]